MSTQCRICDGKPEKEGTCIEIGALAKRTNRCSTAFWREGMCSYLEDLHTCQNFLNNRRGRKKKDVVPIAAVQCRQSRHVQQPEFRFTHGLYYGHFRVGACKLARSKDLSASCDVKGILSRYRHLPFSWKKAGPPMITQLSPR